MKMQKDLYLSRGRMMRSKILFFLITFFLLFCHDLLAKEESEESSLARWIEGPVRYIITSKEEKSFKKLKTDIQRAFFIYRFWFRRDPTPGTLKNEYRELFWDRVITANKMFTETTKPGWKTDRGEIFILLGPPNIIESDTKPDVPFPPPHMSSAEPGHIRYSDSIRNEETLSMGSQARSLTMDTGFRGIRRWIYFQSKSKKIPPHTIIAFYKDSTGEFVLSDNPLHYTNVFPGLAARSDLLSRFALRKTSIPLANPLGDVLPFTLSDTLPPFSFEKSIAFKLDLAEAMEFPSMETLIDEAVTTFEFFNKIKARFQSYFFLNEHNRSYVVIQSVIPRKEIIPLKAKDPILLSLFGRIEKREGDGVYMFANDSSLPGRIIQEEDDLILLAKVDLPPGSYMAKIGILNLPYGMAGNFKMPIIVPDLSSWKPSLSSLVLTSVMAYEDHGGTEFPGNIFIRPKASSRFHKEEQFGIYYHVYHLNTNTATGMPDFNVTYKFYKKEGESYHLILPPTIKEHLQYDVQGWSFPLEKWPSGEYLLELIVKDLISGGASSRTINFEVQ